MRGEGYLGITGFTYWWLLGKKGTCYIWIIEGSYTLLNPRKFRPSKFRIVSWGAVLPHGEWRYKDAPCEHLRSSPRARGACISTNSVCN